MASKPQLLKNIKNKLGVFNIDRRIEESKNEEETLDNLVEPFLKDILQYDFFQISKQVPIGKSRADVAVKIGGKYVIIIEVKSAKKVLKDTHYKQLANYFKNHNESKFGVLTNGKEFRFFTVDWKDKSRLNQKPFFVFNLTDYDDDNLNRLTDFHSDSEISTTALYTEASEGNFNDDFQDAFNRVIEQRNKEILKAIFKEMGGKVFNPKNKSKISALVNASSIEEVLRHVRDSDASDKNRGVTTTQDELDAFNTIKTIMISTSNDIKAVADKINYKDFKSHFSIIYNGMQTKEICRLKLKSTSKTISIAGEKDEQIKNISANELLRFKTRLVNSAKRFIKMYGSN